MPPRLLEQSWESSRPFIEGYMPFLVEEVYNALPERLLIGKGFVDLPNNKLLDGAKAVFVSTPDETGISKTVNKKLVREIAEFVAGKILFTSFHCVFLLHTSLGNKHPLMIDDRPRLK